MKRIASGHPDNRIVESAQEPVVVEVPVYVPEEVPVYVPSIRRTQRYWYWCILDWSKVVRGTP